MGTKRGRVPIFEGPLAGGTLSLWAEWSPGPAAEPAPAPPAGGLREARRYIVETLAARPEFTAPSNDLIRGWAARGGAAGALQAAKRRLGIVRGSPWLVRRGAGKGGVWTWTLPPGQRPRKPRGARP